VDLKEVETPPLHGKVGVRLLLVGVKMGPNIHLVQIAVDIHPALTAVNIQALLDHPHQQDLLKVLLKDTAAAPAPQAISQAVMEKKAI